jgi:hypothetical protein
MRRARALLLRFGIRVPTETCLQPQFLKDIAALAKRF